MLYCCVTFSTFLLWKWRWYSDDIRGWSLKKIKSISVSTCETNGYWFQKDSAVSCPVGTSMDVLCISFSGWIFSQFGDVKQPVFSPLSLFLWYRIQQTMWKDKLKKNFLWLWWIILWQVFWKAYLYTLKCKAAVSYILFPMLSTQNWSEFPTHVEHNFHVVLFNTITCT